MQTEYHKIHGYVLIEGTTDTMPLAIIEIFSGCTFIGVTRSDFDGKFYLSLSKFQLMNDSLFIRTISYHYLVQDNFFRIERDTLINIFVSLDPESKISLDDLGELNYRNNPGCGAYDKNYYETQKPIFKHEDGRVLPYNEIRCDLRGWQLILN